MSMATKKRKGNKKDDWSSKDLVIKSENSVLRASSDEDVEEDDSSSVFDNKKKATAFSMLAALNSEGEPSSDSDISDDNKDIVEIVKTKAEKEKGKGKNGKVTKEALPKFKEEAKGKGKKGKKAQQENDELDALLADIEKLTEKQTTKDKKKGGARKAAVKSVVIQKIETQEVTSAGFAENALSKEVANAEDSQNMERKLPVENVAMTQDAHIGTEVGEVTVKKKDKKKKKKAGVVHEKQENGGAASEADSSEKFEGIDKEEVQEETVTKKKDKKKKEAKFKEGDKKETKKKKQVTLIKEFLRKKQEEEERILREQKEQEERIAAQERARQEEERLAKEKREREKQKKKEREERLKAEGKYLTPAQKEKLRRQQALLTNANIILPTALRQDGEEKPFTKRPVYGRKKQRKPGTKQDAAEVLSEQPSGEPSREGSTEFEKHEKVVEKIAKEIAESDAWDAQDEVADHWEDLNVDEPLKEIQKPTGALEQDSSLFTAEQFGETQKDGAAISQSESSSEESEEETESSEDEQVSKETKEEMKARVRIRLKKRKEAAEAKRTTAVLRSPVICVLGHVDTGKTKMLDTIRRTNVQDGEAGGITQQIGATQVPAAAIVERTKMVRDFSPDKMKIPGFLVIDTPGHESFSNLRSRGSSLCDYAILVVDLMHGLEQQTLESLKLLRKRETPFVIALNKIDRLYDYDSNPRKDIYQHLKAQLVNTLLHFKELKDKVVVQFAEQGVNVAMANENPDPEEYISMVPTSAYLGDGIGNLMAHIAKESQARLAQKLAFCEELDCSVMEVKSLPGLGTTIDVILVNGSLHVGDIIVLTGSDGPVITQIRELLMPHPLKDLRVKNAYEHYQAVRGAQGVKVLAKNLEKALAGLPLYVANREDELEVLKETCESQLSKALMSIKKKPEGVYVQASTLGSLEALLEFLKKQKIPYSNVNIGPVHKKDVQKAAAMLERKEEYACILAFDVRVDHEVELFAASEGVRIFSADIIYHLEDEFLRYREELRLKRRRENEHLAIFPCKLRILPQHIFNARNPIVIGVSVESGQLKRGVPLCVPSKDNIFIGTVMSIERNHEQIELAKTGEEVCIKIENTTGEAPRLYGRHFTHEDTLVSRISRETIDVCKAHFREDLSKADWQLIVQLKKVFDIM